MIKYRMAHVSVLNHHIYSGSSVMMSFEQVVPTNIEKQMMTHPAIEEVGVVGLPHEVDGEWPSAFVVLRKGHTATAEELMDHTNSNIKNLRLEI